MRITTPLFLVFLSGCVPLPYLHDAYLHSNVSGRLIDQKTKLPIAGESVRIADSHAISDADGRFLLPATKVKKLFVVFPLLPFDLAYLCSDQVQISDQGMRQGKKFRGLSVEAHSCRYSIIPGANSYLDNPNIFDDLGSIELSELPMQPRRYD